MIKPRRSLALALAALLAGCAVGPDYHPATPGALGVPPAYSVAGDARPAGDLSGWWRRFDDPLLVRVVEDARAGNLDVAQATARLRQAREALVQSRAALLPALGGSAGYSRDATLNGDPLFRSAPDNFSLGANVAYQAGLFGETRRAVEANRALAAAAGEDRETVVISIEAEAARNYLIARLDQALLANARGSLAIQDDNLTIAGFRVQAGLVSSLDVEQARGARAQTAATIPSLEQQYNAAVSRIGVLTGQAPGTLKPLLAPVLPVPRGPGSVTIGIPADTLRQRPDVAAAERRLAAATAQIGIATAQLYPALSISGNIGASAASFTSLLGLVTGQLFAGLTQTIFNGGRVHAQIRSAEAAADGALAAYRSVLLTSIEDSENAVFALGAAERRADAFTTALDAASNAAILSRSQYRAGLTDFTTLNTAEAALLAARNGLSQAQADQAQALVQLYLALGGGWSAAVDQPVNRGPGGGSSSSVASNASADAASQRQE